MFQIVFESVHREFTADMIARSTCAGAQRAAALDHKAFDDAVECKSVVEALSDEADEIIDCVRRDLRIEFGLDDFSVFHVKGYDWI